MDLAARWGVRRLAETIPWVVQDTPLLVQTVRERGVRPLHPAALRAVLDALRLAAAVLPAGQGVPEKLAVLRVEPADAVNVLGNQKVPTG